MDAKAAQRVLRKEAPKRSWTAKSALISSPRNYRWPDAVIPFEFDDNVGAAMRDEHVTIHWDNLADGMKSNFRIYDPVVVLTTYNVRSIMHYGSYSFSKNGRPTITRKDGTTFRQNFDAPTQRDYDGIT